MEALACANTDGSDRIAKIAGAAFTANMASNGTGAESAVVLAFVSIRSSATCANYVAVLVFVSMEGTEVFVKIVEAVLFAPMAE